MSVQWAVFLSLVLASYISPGPDTVMILRSSVGGRLVAMAAAAGALCSLTVHMLVSAVGLSALIVALPGSLTVLAILGAAYLAYLGIRAPAESGRTRRRGASPLTVGTGPVSDLHARRRAFRSTFLTNLTNPKVILFFVAVLPQFVDRSSSWPVAVQLGILGAADVLVGIVYLPILVLFGVKAFRNLGPRGLANLELGVGLLLLIFAGASFWVEPVRHTNTSACGNVRWWNWNPCARSTMWNGDPLRPPDVSSVGGGCSSYAWRYVS